MSNNVRYHVSNVENSNATSSYGEFSSIDFVLNASGRKLVKNSIRIEADVVITYNGNPLTTANTVKIDNKLGGHVFWDSWSVTMPESKGLIQNGQEYGRYVKQIGAGSESQNDVFSADMLAELRGYDEQNGKINLEPSLAFSKQTAQADLDASQEPVNFSIKPLICVNQMQGDNYSFDKLGQIRLSANLARNSKALFGRDIATATPASYELQNVVCRYMTIPDDGQQGKILMNSYTMIKNSINSNNANISCKVPSNAVSSVTISFLESANESSLTNNSYALNRFPNFQELNYNFSDSTNQYISYTITDQGDSQHKALEGLKSLGYDDINANTYRANNGYLLGLDFNDQFTDLSRNKFSLNIKSKESNIPSLNVYLYFNSLLVI